MAVTLWAGFLFHPEDHHMKTKLCPALVALVIFFLSGCSTFVSDLKNPDPGPPDPQHVPYSYDGR